MALIRDIINGKIPFRRFNKDAMVCIDYANWHQFLKREKARLNWKEFRSFMELMFKSAKLYFYDGIQTEKYYRFHHPDDDFKDFLAAKARREAFYNKLREYGYTVRTKPLTEVHKRWYRGSTAERLEFKCNFDVEITIDAMDFINDYEFFVLCSGDGDFIALIKRLKNEPRRASKSSEKRAKNEAEKQGNWHCRTWINMVSMITSLRP